MDQGLLPTTTGADPNSNRLSTLSTMSMSSVADDSSIDRKYILVVGPPKSGKIEFLKAFSGSLPVDFPPQDQNINIDQDAPSPPQTASLKDKRIFLQQDLLNHRPSHAGICHSTTLINKYFTAALPTWIDEFSYFDGISSPPEAPSRSTSADPDAMDTGSTTNLAADNANSLEDITYWTNAYTSDDQDVRSVRDSLLAVIYTFSPFTPFPYHTHREMYNNIESPIMAASTAAAQAQAEAEVQARIAREQEDQEHLDTISHQISQILKLLDKLEIEGWDGIFLAVCRNIKNTVEAGEQLPYYSKHNIPEAIQKAKQVTQFVREQVLGDTLYETVDLNEGDSSLFSNGFTNTNGSSSVSREPLGMARVKDVLGTHVALSGWSADPPTDSDAIIGNTGIGTIYGAPQSDSAMDFDQPEPPTPMLETHSATPSTSVPGPASNVPPPLPLDRNTRTINSSSEGSSVSGNTSAMVTPTSGTAPMHPAELFSPPGSSLSSSSAAAGAAAASEGQDSYNDLSCEIDKMYREAVNRTGLRMPLAEDQDWGAAIGATRRVEDQQRARFAGGEGSEADVRKTEELAEQVRSFRENFKNMTQEEAQEALDRLSVELSRIL